MSSRKSQDRDLPKTKLSKEALKRSMRLFRYMSTRNRWLFALGTLFLGITAGASILFPKLLGDMMDGIFIYGKEGFLKLPISPN